MAFFKFRKARDEQPAPAAPAQTVEAMRRRALHRLIGAAVLVLAGVIGFPLVFDNQPRPIPVDLPIEIVDKAKAKPLVVPPATPAVPKAEAAADVPAAAAPVAKAPPATTAPAPAAAPVAAAPEPATVPAVTKVAAPPAAEASVARSGDAGKAQALLDGKDPAAGPTAAGDGRFVVQVGAFSDADKLREVRRKVEGAGLKTYTQVVETKEGSRTRVRVGPFTDKDQASKVAEKIRKLDLPASILSL